MEIYIFLLVFLFHSHLFWNAVPLNANYLEILKYLLFYLQFYFQLNHQLLLQFFELLFSKQFLFRLCRFFSTAKNFLTILMAHALATLFVFLPIFLANDKTSYPFTYILSLGSTEYLIFILAILFNY